VLRTLCLDAHEPLRVRTTEGGRMPLIDRITRLFTADVHAVLDRLEEPDTLLKQALREMEDELAACETRIRWLTYEREETHRQSNDVARELDRIAEQLDVCFAAGEEPLARGLLKRRLELERHAKRLSARADSTAKALAADVARLDEQRHAFDALRLRAEPVLDGTTRGYASYSHVLDTPVTDADVDVELLREKQRRSGR
jgi:predicted RNase H-like nuclease (RuvC/YqgF family)